MLFNSYAFIFLFFPICYLISTWLSGQRLIAWIALASVVFYALAGHLWFLVPMFITTSLDFYLAKKMESADSSQKRKRYLVISLIGNLGLLFFFKYVGFFATNVQLLSSFLGLEFKIPVIFTEVILPAGISFYTFQTLSYMIDVYKRECRPEVNFLKFLAFVTFFPHLVAGPLTRHHQLLPQLDKIEREGMKVRAISGLTLFIIGLTKKVLIADLIATQIDPLLSQIDNLSIIDAWLVSTGYMMQIYFDFSGYSEMAIGLGRFFGIELPLNFNRPYLARNPIEFWKRWHISLSLWLRDYLYIPLGGSRSSKFRTNLNLMLTMVLGGFWHGANWTFVTWGAIHGMALLIYRNFKIENSSLLSRFGFLLLLLFSWVFFRSQNVSEALIIIKRHFVATHLAQEINFFLIFLILMGIVIVIFEPNFVLITEKRDKLSIKYKIIFGLLLGVCISFFARTSIFLYFQF